jgi:hypothetical protein
MRRILARRLYNLTGNLGVLFLDLSGTKLGYFEWPYRIGNWLYGRHYRIAVKHGFWKINPAWTGNNDEPKYIDA